MEIDTTDWFYLIIEEWIKRTIKGRPARIKEYDCNNFEIVLLAALSMTMILIQAGSGSSIHPCETISGNMLVSTSNEFQFGPPNATHQLRVRSPAQQGNKKYILIIAPALYEVGIRAEEKTSVHPFNRRGHCNRILDNFVGKSTLGDFHFSYTLNGSLQYCFFSDVV
ncbi:MAG: hypothetical protein Q6373_009005 [Candidatus Sigynarchaeota archaeon]